MLPKKLKNFSILLILLVFFAGGFLFFPRTTHALGISPPWVKVPNLLRGSHVEKTVVIVQGDPKEPLLAKVQIIVPEVFKKWITILPGTEFTIPQVRQFPVTVVIDVPENAEFGRYTGEIAITTESEKKDGTQVAIGIGVVIELDCEVTEKESIDYTIPFQKIMPMEEGWPVKVSFTIDNKGNARAKPKKVLLTVYKGMREGALVGNFENTNLPHVEAFTKGEIVAEFPMDLKVSSYWAKIAFYKNEEEKIDYEFSFDVLPRGTLPKSPKPWWFWASITLGVLLAGTLITALIKLRFKIGRFFVGIKAKFQNAGNKFKKILKVLKEKE